VDILSICHCVGLSCLRVHFAPICICAEGLNLRLKLAIALCSNSCTHANLA
jgi:hypothetical protein